jgi:single-strand DNA-binding protein
MANDINRICLIGRFTKDPELKFTPTNTPIANFSLANNRSYAAGNGEKKEQVSFFNCIAWGKGGQLISQYCKKGQRIVIEGRLQQRSWDDKDGNKRSTVEIVVENFQFLDSPQQSADRAPGVQGAKNTPEVESYPDFSKDYQESDGGPFSDSDIPF